MNSCIIPINFHLFPWNVSNFESSWNFETLSTTTSSCIITWGKRFTSSNSVDQEDKPLAVMCEHPVKVFPVTSRFSWALQQSVADQVITNKSMELTQWPCSVIEHCHLLTVGFSSLDWHSKLCCYSISLDVCFVWFLSALLYFFNIGVWVDNSFFVIGLAMNS